jgi:hypothetical protein
MQSSDQIPDGPVTTGELARRMTGLERRMDMGFEHVQRSIETLRYVHIDRYDAERSAITERLATIEATARWLSRAVSGAVIAAVITAIVSVLVARGGV